MMLFKINRSHIKLLVDALGDSNIASKFNDAEEYVEKEKYHTDRYVVDLCDNERESIIDSLGDFLMSSGLSECGELDPVGRQIESLIDIFSNR